MVTKLIELYSEINIICKKCFDKNRFDNQFVKVRYWENKKSSCLVETIEIPGLVVFIVKWKRNMRKDALGLKRSIK